MIPNYQDRQLESNGISDVASFGISLDDSAHIMTILRDTLYSDKVLAVLREYSANAWDAHRMVGKGDVPIKVVLPTYMAPTLVIQDFGPGLSHSEVFTIYTQYGASTKRNSNIAVGQLGIGSKSGFAYSDSFTITSCHGGKRRTYVAILDESEKGAINLLDEQDCLLTDTGITIQIPVKPEDIKEFMDKAENLFKFFVPRPDINITLPPETPVRMSLKTGLIYDDRERAGNWIAVMGCIPYRLNLDQINIVDSKDDKTGVGNWVHKLSGALFFNIGEVHISASREELKYSKSTKQTIITRFTELIDEFVTNTISAIQTGVFTSWEKRLRSQILSRFDLPVPDDCKELVQSYVNIQAESADYAKTFKFLTKDKENCIRHFSVNPRSRVVLCDDKRKLVGFSLDSLDYVLFRNDEETPWEEVLVELEGYLKKEQLDGVPIVKLSEQTWTAPFVKFKNKKPANPKYYRKSFVLVPRSHYSSPYSNAWEPTDVGRVATDTDVFVLMDGFRTDALGFDIYSRYRQDSEMLECLGEKMPAIYGYKTTEKKPLKAEDCVGITYQAWRKKFFEALVLDKVKKNIEVFDWHKVYRYRWDKIEAGSIDKTLGVGHLIVQTLKKARRSYNKWYKYSAEKQRAFRHLGNLYYDELKNVSEASSTIKNIYDRYPLLGVVDNNLECLWGGHSIQWLEYIQLIDRVLPMNLMTLTPVPDEERDNDDD